MNQRTEKPTEIQTLIKLGLFTKKTLKTPKQKETKPKKSLGWAFEKQFFCNPGGWGKREGEDAKRNRKRGGGGERKAGFCTAK